MGQHMGIRKERGWMGVAGQGVCTRGESLGLQQRPVEGEAGASVCTTGPRCMPREQRTLAWPVAQVRRGVTRRMERW